MSDSQDVCADPACAELAALIAEASLGTLHDQTQRARLLGALVRCAECRRRFDDYLGLPKFLAASVPQLDPPPQLQLRVIEAARRARPATPRARLARRQWPLLRRAVLPVLALLLLLVGAWGVRANQQHTALQAQLARNRAAVIAAFGNPDALEIVLQAPQAETSAWGRLFVSPGAPGVALYTRQLPALPPGQVYQLWLVHAGASTPITTFNSDAEGRAWVVNTPPHRLATPDLVLVTVEPAGGSPAPLGSVVLSGSLRGQLPAPD